MIIKREQLTCRGQAAYRQKDDGNGGSPCHFLIIFFNYPAFNVKKNRPFSCWSHGSLSHCLSRGRSRGSSCKVNKSEEGQADEAHCTQRGLTAGRWAPFNKPGRSDETRQEEQQFEERELIQKGLIGRGGVLVLHASKEPTAHTFDGRMSVCVRGMCQAERPAGGVNTLEHATGYYNTLIESTRHRRTLQWGRG